MSLRPSNWNEFVQASDLYDYFECRLGESFEAALTFTSGTPPVAQNITGWTFAVSYVDATADIDEGFTDVLNSISNIVLLTSTSQTNAGLVITNINALAGTATLTIPAVVLSMPVANAPINSTNTLLKLFQIVINFPGVSAGFTNTRKIGLGAIVRWAQ